MSTRGPRVRPRPGPRLSEADDVTRAAWYENYGRFDLGLLVAQSGLEVPTLVTSRRARGRREVRSVQRDDDDRDAQLEGLEGGRSVTSWKRRV